MPTLEIKASDGKTYEVDVDEGVTEQAARDYVESSVVPKSPSGMAGFMAGQAVEGLGAIPGLIADVGVGAVDYARQGLGYEPFNQPYPSTLYKQTVRSMGFPQPNNGLERVAGDVIQGAASGAGLGLGGVISGASAGGSAGLAREAGAPWWLQIPAAIGGGYLGMKYAGAIGNAVETGASAQADKIRRGASAQPTTGTPATGAYQKVVDKLRADFPDPEDFKKALTQYAKEKGVTLAEIGGERTKSLAVGSAQFPSGGAKIAETLDERVAGVPERIFKSVSENISNNVDYDGLLDSILKKGRAKAAPYYEAAYKQVVNIDDIPDEVAAAIKSARKTYPSELNGLPDNSVKVLDYAKRELDDVIGAAKRSGEANLARSRTELVRGFIEKVKAQSPDYAKALDEAGDYLSHKTAIETGKSFNKMTPNEIRKTLKSLNPSEKDAFLAGVSDNVRSTMSSNATSPNYARLVFGGTDNSIKRQQLKAALGEKEFVRLEKTVRAEQNLYNLKTKVLGGSPTSARQMARAEFEGPELDQFLEAASSIQRQGATMTTLDFVTQGVSKFGKRIWSGLSDKSAEDVAKILMETDPKKKLAFAKRVLADTGVRKDAAAEQMRVYFIMADKLKSMQNAKIQAGQAASIANITKE